MKNNSLIPSSKVTAGTPTLQKGIIKRIQEIRNQSIPWVAKHKLVKQTLRQIHQVNLEATREVVLKDTLLKKEQFVLQMQEVYVDLFTRVGVKVQMSMFESLTEFATMLTKFKNELKTNEKINEEYKNFISEVLDETFDRVINKLEELACDFLVGSPEGIGSRESANLKGERSVPPNTLEAEMDYFEKHMEELLKLYEGKYVAIKGKEVICVKDSADDIIKEVYTNGAMIKGRFIKGSEIGAVLIQKVTKEPSEEFIFTTKDGTSNG